jgi:hypothetical protein
VTRRRELAELGAGLLVLAAIFLTVRLLVAPYVITGFFARPTRAAPAGGAVWSNLVASVVCVLVAWWRIRAKMIAHHAQQLAQSAAHHKELLAQAATHHQELTVRLDRHHSEMLRRHDQALDLAEVQQRAIVQQAERHHEALLGAVAAAAPVPLEPLISAEAPAVPVPGPAAERLTGRAVRPKGAPRGRAS